MRATLAQRPSPPPGGSRARMEGCVGVGDAHTANQAVVPDGAA